MFFFQRKLRKKKEKFNKEKLLNAELLTDFGKREWEYEASVPEAGLLEDQVGGD